MASRSRRIEIATLLIASLAATLATAAPDFRESIPAGDLTFYRDSEDARTFYYPPGDLVLATDADGKPAFSFLSIAYSGTAVSGDRGQILHRNLISFRVAMEGPSPAALRAARRRLPGAAPRLRPLPIRRLDSAAIYTPVRPAAEPERLPDGHFGTTDSGPGTSRDYWKERTYTLPLDNESADLFWNALQESQVVISVGFAFYSPGIGGATGIDLVGTPELVEALESKAGEAGGSESVRLVRAGATEITVDAERWPDLFSRIQLDGNVPPGYALLDVYCYDFQLERDDDLHEIEVEIEAQSVAGRSIHQTVSFKRSSPDVYAHSVRFSFAVLPDRPYRYRVTSWFRDGASRVRPWVDVDHWGMLDVTSAPDPAMESGT